MRPAPPRVVPLCHACARPPRLGVVNSSEMTRPPLLSCGNRGVQPRTSPRLVRHSAPRNATTWALAQESGWSSSRPEASRHSSWPPRAARGRQAPHEAAGRSERVAHIVLAAAVPGAPRDKGTDTRRLPAAMPADGHRFAAARKTRPSSNTTHVTPSKELGSAGESPALAEIDRQRVQSPTACSAAQPFHEPYPRQCEMPDKPARMLKPQRCGAKDR